MLMNRAGAGAFLFAMALSVAQAQQTKLDRFADGDQKLAKMSGHLLDARQEEKAGRGLSATAKRHLAGAIHGDEIQVKIKCDQITQDLLDALKSAGIRVVRTFKDNNVIIAGTSRIQNLDAIARRSDVKLITEGTKPIRRSGLISNPVPPGGAPSQGDHSMNADAARTTYGVDGTGVKVGILSDSFDVSHHAGDAVITGDLPSNVTVLQEGLAGDTDEGEGMAEIVHDVAPGAQLYFATADGGELNFAYNILNLFNAGCNVIVDDVGYPDEPLYQDGPIATAVQTVVSNGATYFSAAGNDDSQAYNGPFVDIDTQHTDQFYPPTGVDFHNFGGGKTRLKITIPYGQGIAAILKWNEPYGGGAAAGPGSTADLDLYLVSDLLPLKPIDTTPPFTGSNIIAQSITTQGDKAFPFGDSVEVLQWGNDGSYGSNTTFYLVIDRRGDPPTYTQPTLMNLTIFASGGVIFNDSAYLGGPTIWGHPNAAGAMGMAAIFHGEIDSIGSLIAPAGQYNVECYSSRGGSLPFYFKEDGSPLPGAPVFRFKPDLTAPDGANTLYFGMDDEVPCAGVTTDPDSSPNFFGTSAAAPHAAGVAALMQDRAANTLSPAALYSILKATAVDSETPGVDALSGSGWINALAAVGASPSMPHPTPTPTKSPTKTASATPTRTGSPSPTRSATPSPSNTASPSPSRSTTPTPSRTATASHTITATLSPTRTASLTPTRTATPSPTRTSSLTPTSTRTATLTPTPTRTATVSGTGTVTPSPTMTASESPTRTATLSPTVTATLSPTRSATPSPTRTSSASPTISATVSPTRTSTPTPTPALDAIIVTHTIPAMLMPGETVNASVTVRNTGGTTWVYDGLPPTNANPDYGLEVIYDPCTLIASSFINLPGPLLVPQGAEVTFPVTIFGGPPPASPYPIPCRIDFQMAIDRGTPPFPPPPPSPFGQILHLETNIDDGSAVPGAQTIEQFSVPPNTAQGWVGGVVPGFTGDPAEAVTANTAGLCMYSPAMSPATPYDNVMTWYSPNALIPLVDNAVYRLRVFMTTDQFDPDRIPLWEVTYSNLYANPVTDLTYPQNYGGEAWFLDVAEGGNGIQRPTGRSMFELWLTPIGVKTPQWRGTLDAANSPFDPSVDAVNDMMVFVRLLNLGNLRPDLTPFNRFKSICLSGVRVDRFDMDSIPTDQVLYDEPITNNTHAPFVYGQNPLFAEIDDVNHWATYNLRTSGAIFPSTINDAARMIPAVDLNPPLKVYNVQGLYPIIWHDNVLFKAEADIEMVAAQADPPDMITIHSDTATSEIGHMNWATRGLPGYMNLAASPRNEATAGGPQTYTAFFFTQNATQINLSLYPEYNRLRPMVEFTNRSDIVPDPSGGDQVRVRALRMTQMILPP